MNINPLSLCWRALLPLAVIVLAGCSAMGRSECEVSDWRSVGFEDGARGASVARIGDYRKACAKHGVTPDLEAYRAGYAQGVETYCRAANGFNLGSSGGAYGGMCPGELEGEFLSGYQSGRQLYELNAAVNAVSSQIAGKRHALSEVREAQSVKEAALLDKDTPDNERVLLANDIYELGRRQGKLESEIGALQRELGARQEELDKFRESLAYNR
jgi:Protein of unknown function (DUF2799)